MIKTLLTYLQCGHWRDDVLQINQVSDQNSWMNWGGLDLDGLGLLGLTGLDGTKLDLLR